MLSDQLSHQEPDEAGSVHAPTSSGMQSISLLPFAVQPQDIYPVEIVARRFPVSITTLPLPIKGEFNITELNINAESLQAQVVLEVRIESTEEPRAFEIFSRIVGAFVYSSEYTPEMVSEFLQQGSLSILLPFARELVLSLSTRLHLPPIVLSLVQLAPPPETRSE